MTTLKVNGMLIRFGSPRDHDLEREFFSKATDYAVEDGASLPIFFNHGLDPIIGRRRLGRGVIAFKSRGIFIAGEIAIKDDFDQAIADLIDEGAMGWSSGSASHLTERIDYPNGVKLITAWPLAEASITPYPAEIRNGANAVKSVREIERRRLENESLRLKWRTLQLTMPAIGRAQLAREREALVIQNLRLRHEARKLTANL